MSETNEYSEHEYRKSIDAIAREALRWVREEDASESDAVRELCDHARWVIYTYQSRMAIMYSRNEDAIFEELGNEALADCPSTGEMHRRVAFYAVCADVFDRLAELRNEEEASE